MTSPNLLRVASVVCLLAACGNDTKVMMPPAEQQYTFTWRWKLVDSTDGPDPEKARLIACAEAGASYIGMVFRDTKTRDTYPYEILCTSTGRYTSDKMKGGAEYEFAAAVLTSKKDVLNAALPERMTLDKDTDLGEYLIPLNPKRTARAERAGAWPGQVLAVDEVTLWQ